MDLSLCVDDGGDDDDNSYGGTNVAIRLAGKLGVRLAPLLHAFIAHSAYSILLNGGGKTCYGYGVRLCKSGAPNMRLVAKRFLLQQAMY